MKNQILLFIKTPPPTTGATLMNQRIYDSKLLRDSFTIRSICISYMQKLNDMGKWKISKVFIVLKIFLKLINELWFHRPNMIYFQISPHGFAFLRDFIFVLIMKIHRVKIVFHLHGKGINKKSNFKKIFYRFCFNNEKVICLSPLLAYDIEGVYKDKIFFVPNGMPDINKEPVKKTNYQPIRLLFLSNLILSKGILDYIEALRILSEKHIDYQGLIIGAESDLTKDELNKLLEEAGIADNVKYLGPKYGEEKERIINSIDVMIFPTWMKQESFPIVLLEMLMNSVPAISTYEGGIPEIIEDGITGFIVDKNSPAKIAEKIEFLKNNPEKRIEMGKAGRKKFLDKYTIDKFERNLNKVFEEILNKEG